MLWHKYTYIHLKNPEIGIEQNRIVSGITKHIRSKTKHDNMGIIPLFLFDATHMTEQINYVLIIETFFFQEILGDDMLKKPAFSIFVLCFHVCLYTKRIHTGSRELGRRTASRSLGHPSRQNRREIPCMIVESLKLENHSNLIMSKNQMPGNEMDDETNGVERNLFGVLEMSMITEDMHRVDTFYTVGTL